MQRWRFVPDPERQLEARTRTALLRQSWFVLLGGLRRFFRRLTEAAEDIASATDAPRAAKTVFNLSKERACKRLLIVADGSLRRWEGRRMSRACVTSKKPHPAAAAAPLSREERG